MTNINTTREFITKVGIVLDQIKLELQRFLSGIRDAFAKL